MVWAVGRSVAKRTKSEGPYMVGRKMNVFEGGPKMNVVLSRSDGTSRRSVIIFMTSVRQMMDAVSSTRLAQKMLLKSPVESKRSV